MFGHERHETRVKTGIIQKAHEPAHLPIAQIHNCHLNPSAVLFIRWLTIDGQGFKQIQIAERIRLFGIWKGAPHCLFHIIAGVTRHSLMPAGSSRP